MNENLGIRQNSAYMINNKLYCNGIELPSLPHNKKPANVTQIGNNIYADGYELCDNKWKRTFKAWIARHIGWGI